MARRKRLKLSTPREIKHALTRLSNMVLNDELDPKQANTIMYACNIILSAIRTDEQQKKIDELERLVMRMTK